MGYVWKVLVCIAKNPGVVSVAVADTLPIEHRLYGRQRATSAAVATLRRGGFIRDVDRCDCCNRALTRGQRNVGLFATPKGIEKAAEYESH